MISVNELTFQDVLKQMYIKVKYDEGAYKLVRATQGSTGFDLSSIEDVVIKPGETVTVRTGIYLEFSPFLDVQIRNRSSFIRKKCYSQYAPATMDMDYQGEYSVILTNYGSEPFVIHKGDRIAQLVVTLRLPVQIIEVNKLGNSERGTGGFGSTGTTQTDLKK